MTVFRADLHCHSNCSDGTKSPEELIQMAVDIGLSGLSITDHDSVDAYPLAIPLAEKLNLKLISGAEFSSMHGSHSIHVLAYAFSTKNPLIIDLCKKHHARREKRNREILLRLNRHNMIVTEEEISSIASTTHSPQTIGRPHIALVMVQKGYVQTIQEAFKKFLGEGKSCYISGETLSTQETIDIIHQAKGLAILAHPHLLNSSIVHHLLSMNFDGLECYYGKLFPEQHHHWVKIAKKKDLLITGGSDYHGDIKPDISLGCSWIDSESFQILQDHYQSNT